MDDRVRDIINALQSGEFLLSLHAARRMRQRSITKADIQACGQTAKSYIYQPHKDTYRILGEDIDGESLTVVCAVDRFIVIVTLF
jgi:hypothetical protein